MEYSDRQLEPYSSRRYAPSEIEASVMSYANMQAIYPDLTTPATPVGPLSFVPSRPGAGSQDRRGSAKREDFLQNGRPPGLAPYLKSPAAAHVGHEETRQSDLPQQYESQVSFDGCFDGQFRSNTYPEQHRESYQGPFQLSPHGLNVKMENTKNYSELHSDAYSVPANAHEEVEPGSEICADLDWAHYNVATPTPTRSISYATPSKQISPFTTPLITPGPYDMSPEPVQLSEYPFPSYEPSAATSTTPRNMTHRHSRELSTASTMMHPLVAPQHFDTHFVDRARYPNDVDSLDAVDILDTLETMPPPEGSGDILDALVNYPTVDGPAITSTNSGGSNSTVSLQGSLAPVPEDQATLNQNPAPITEPLHPSTEVTPNAAGKDASRITRARRSQSDGQSPKPARRDSVRRRISREQTDLLETAFQRNQRPEREERDTLADATGLEHRTVQIWFQNRRAKDRSQKAQQHQLRQQEQEQQHLQKTQLDEPSKGASVPQPTQSAAVPIVHAAKAATVVPQMAKIPELAAVRPNGLTSSSSSSLCRSASDVGWEWEPTTYFQSSAGPGATNLPLRRSRTASSVSSVSLNSVGGMSPGLPPVWSDDMPLSRSQSALHLSDGWQPPGSEVKRRRSIFGSVPSWNYVGTDSPTSGLSSSVSPPRTPLEYGTPTSSTPNMFAVGAAAAAAAATAAHNKVHVGHSVSSAAASAAAAAASFASSPAHGSAASRPGVVRARSATQPGVRYRQAPLRLQLDESGHSAKLVMVSSGETIPDRSREPSPKGVNQTDRS